MIRTGAVVCLFLASCSHGTPVRHIALRYDDDIKLDHNLIMICAYDHTLNQIGCMSPEQFEIRSSQGEFK